MINLEEHNNTVELLGYYGGDIVHAQSAWTSTIRDIDDKKIQRMPALLKMLAENGHETPFEKSSLHFLVTTDIASHIHLIKHRIGVSINGESARYKELKDDKFYIPQDWPLEEVEIYYKHLEDSLKKYHETLERLVKNGMEQLPIGLYSDNVNFDRYNDYEEVYNICKRGVESAWKPEIGMPVVDEKGNNGIITKIHPNGQIETTPVPEEKMEEMYKQYMDNKKQGSEKFAPLLALLED